MMIHLSSDNNSDPYIWYTHQAHACHTEVEQSNWWSFYFASIYSIQFYRRHSLNGLLFFGWKLTNSNFIIRNFANIKWVLCSIICVYIVLCVVGWKRSYWTALPWNNTHTHNIACNSHIWLAFLLLLILSVVAAFVIVVFVIVNVKYVLAFSTLNYSSMCIPIF